MKHEHEDPLGLALDAAQVGTFDWDVLRDRLVWSRWHEQLWDFLPGEFDETYEAFARRIHPSDLPAVNAEINRCIGARAPFQREYRVVWSDGSVHWILSRGAFTFDASGRAVRMRGVVLEITAQRQAEEQARAIAELKERTLHHERDFSEAALNSLPGVLYLYDQSGRFLRWNKNFERVTGYTAMEIALMRPHQFFPMADRERADAKILEVFDAGESSLEAGLLTRGGEVRPYYFTGVKAQLNGQTCLVGVGLDLTERKTAEARYRALFEHAPDGILIADGQSYYLDANASMCRMLGYTHDELVGLHASDITAPTQTSRINPVINDIKTRTPHHQEWLLRRKDGSLFPVEIIATLMPDGNLMGMIRDISERKATEQALHDLNESLERKVSARTGELQKALLRAEAADQLKSSFLATMSHELRTPLNSILGFTGIILQGLAGPLNQEQSKQLGMVRSSARHLLSLINDVLDLSKIEARQLEVRAEAFDLRASMLHVLASMKPLAEKKGLTLDAQLPSAEVTMVSDKRRVEQIVLNLLNNAIKFTDRGSVQLTVELLGDPDNQLARLRVTDTGIGIKAADVETLFQPFHQIDVGFARHHEGTGLGLAICRRLASLLGGEISVTSEWSKGSEFTVTLPLQRKAL